MKVKVLESGKLFGERHNSASDEQRNNAFRHPQGTKDTPKYGRQPQNTGDSLKIRVMDESVRPYGKRRGDGLTGILRADGRG